MFTTIQPHEFEKNSGLMQQAFQLRKKVFHDQLEWDVPVSGDIEKDEYDEMGASYLVWCSDDRHQLYGVVRLMPTNGPTLLHDVFHATHGSNPELIDPSIWEGTRMCVDEDAIARDFPDLDAGRGFSLLLLALCEAGLKHGIKRLVSNFEPSMSRLYRRAGLSYKMHGSADGYGKRPVYCASFEVSADVLVRMREKIGIDMPVFVPSASLTALVSEPHVCAALEQA